MVNDICEINVIHEELVEKVKSNMLDENKIIDLSELFKVFGDSTRMKIICALLQGELCVCDIAYIINSTVSAVSHQLRILKQAKLVKYHKEGKVVYYSLDDEHVYEIFKKGCEHIEEI
mgnify:CR=1 FL=1